MYPPEMLNSISVGKHDNLAKCETHLVGLDVPAAPFPLPLQSV
jgi:hypothetical protein